MSASAAASAAGAPRNPATSLPALPDADELVRVDVGERREPEVGIADQLGHHASRAEGDERPEHRVLRDAGEQLDAALDLRLHDHGAADALGRGTHGLRVGEVERRRRPTPSCALLPAAVLTTTGKPSSRRGGCCLVRRGREALVDER